jgi:hypothetical protein
MTEHRWTASMVEERMAEAAQVLRGLPQEWGQGHFSSWPEVVRDFWDAFGWHDAVLRPARPSPAAIDSMDEAMTWLRWLDPIDAKIVWERAANTRWKPICYRFGMAPLDGMAALGGGPRSHRGAAQRQAAALHGKPCAPVR